MQFYKTFLTNLLIAAVLFSAFDAFGRTIPFYNDKAGWTIEAMNSVIEKAAVGDVLVFDDQHKFKIGEKLGCGGNTCIFELLDLPRKALRVPWQGPHSPHRSLDFINLYITGYKTLKERGVPIVEVFDFVPDHYVVVEELHIKTSLYEFLRHSLTYTKKQRELMTKQLLEFAKLTKDFVSIGDFNSHQVAYVESRGWVLIDWTSYHEVRRSELQNQNTFDTIFKFEKNIIKLMADPDSKQGQWLSELKMKIKNAITRERYGRRFSECQQSMITLLSGATAH